MSDSIASAAPEQNIDKLMNEISELKAANSNMIQYIIRLIDSLEAHGKIMVASSNTMFTYSNKLRELVRVNVQKE